MVPLLQMGVTSGYPRALPRTVSLGVNDLNTHLRWSFCFCGRKRCQMSRLNWAWLLDLVRPFGVPPATDKKGQNGFVFRPTKWSCSLTSCSIPNVLLALKGLPTRLSLGTRCAITPLDPGRTGLTTPPSMDKKLLPGSWVTLLVCHLQAHDSLGSAKRHRTCHYTVWS